ncbi:hypothetical protein KR093_003454 [Drosophila rubida]|uniref:Prolyl 4-hydroxylase N-terminal domain-containing protein n=1 Tax=Drosophila rubida TaxID=30044 RepID=A0AAD4KD31_9MUSC|nr:hypothetical protein KR093_003454 [Drosophila rubida]
MLLLCALVLCVAGVASCEPLANSTYHMQRMLEGEDHLLNDLRDYIDAVQRKLKNIRIILSDARQREKEAQLDPLGFVSNPLNSFPLVRRMHSDVAALYSYLKREEGEHLQQIADYRLDVVSAADVQFAADSVLHIQQTYQLNERDLAKGLVQQKHYKAKLNTQDCVYLAKHLQRQGQQQQAVKWLELALEQYKETPERVLQELSLDRVAIQQQLTQMKLPQSAI